jgi:hypothetical protein
VGSYDWLRRAPKELPCERIIVGQGNLRCRQPGRAHLHPTGVYMVLCDECATPACRELTFDEYQVYRVMES